MNVNYMSKKYSAVMYIFACEGEAASWARWPERAHMNGMSKPQLQLSLSFSVLIARSNNVAVKKILFLIVFPRHYNNVPALR